MIYFLYLKVSVYLDFIYMYWIPIMKKLQKPLLSGLVLIISMLFIVACEQAVKTTGPTVTVYKSPTCGCCKKWVSHLEANGFQVKAVDLTDMNVVKERYGVQPRFASCHTAVVNGYIIEGHVPADLIRKLLKEKPKVVGLTVPGMPMGAPGMEGPRKQAYNVLTFDKSGKLGIYDKR